MSLFQRWEKATLTFMGGKITFQPPGSWAEESIGDFAAYQNRKAALQQSGWMIEAENDSPPGAWNPSDPGFGMTELKRKK